MTRRPVTLTLAAALLALSLTGCGVKEKAEFAMLMDANAQHPEFMRAAARSELAGLLALMRLTPAQASSFSAWAAEHGAAVRGEVDQTFGTMSGAAGQVSAAGDGLLTGKVDTVVGQKQHMDAALGDKAGLVSGDDEPVSMEKLLAPHLDSIQPLAKALTDRQVLILTGHWKDASEQAAAVVAAKADDPELDGHKMNLTMIILDGRGRGADPDDTSQASVEKLVNALKTGQADASGADAEVAKLFAAVKNQAEYDPLAVATPTLATILCQPSAVELLGMIK